MTMTKKEKLRSRLYWKRWNLDYTKRVLAQDPLSPMAKALLSCWSERIQRALRSRYLTAATA